MQLSQDAPSIQVGALRRKLWNEAMQLSGAALESEAEVAAISSASDERLGDDSAEGETVENPLSAG